MGWILAESSGQQLLPPLSFFQPPKVPDYRHEPPCPVLPPLLIPTANKPHAQGQNTVADSPLNLLHFARKDK